MQATIRILYHVVIPLVAAALACIGAALAYADSAGWGGLLLGGVGGALVIAVVACAVRHMLALCSPAIVSNQQEQSASPRLDRVADRIGRAAALAFLIVVVHEAYWLLQVAALCANHTTAAVMTQATYSDSPRAPLREMFNELRPLHEVWQIRPTRWLIRDEVMELNAANLLFIRVINGEVEPHVSRENDGLLDRIGDAVAAKAWKSDNFIARRWTSRAINVYGAGMCKKAEEQIESHWRRGWILRWIDLDWLKTEENGRP